MGKPLVSVITASYNAENFIEETIKSVQSQTYQYWEMLITDDCSKDKTCEIIERISQKDSRVKLFKLEKNLGPAVARNNSIKEAKGRFIAFLDSDDLWLPDKLNIQINEMTDKNYAVSFTSYIYIDELGKHIGKEVQAIKLLSYSKLLKNNYIGNLTGIYDAKLIGKIYNPMLRKRQDWCIWLEALKKSNKPALGIQNSLSKYRIRSNSLSSKKFQLIKYNYLVYRNFLKYNTFKSVGYLIIFLIEYFFVRYKYIKKTSN